MLLAAGTRLGPYEIVAPIGAGGMGEVYRARDTRLGRDVAVKVLPEHLSADPEVRARFEREAKTVSSLNHPNICTLFDVGRENDTDYLVMELIQGDTLAERLKRGPLHGSELLKLAIQIADALDRAHRAGVIHRDLKPGNIMLTRSGAKLMDFGLARAGGLAAKPGSGSGSPALSQSPTVAQALTAEGSIVGTFQYMSPEQLEGKEADVRSDIWAFGCVLYEMATGRRAFEGRSQASLIAAILERDPPAVGEAPSGTPVGDAPPHGLERLIRTCLAKDPEERNQTAHDVKLQLQWIAENAGLSGVRSAPSTPAAVPLPARRGGSPLPWIAAAAMALVAGAAVMWALSLRSAPHLAYRFRTEGVPEVADYFWPRVSPDGRYLVFDVQDSTGKVSAWLRALDQTEAHAIAGAEDLRRAYWSPDSREIVFVSDNKIERLPISGGVPTVVCAANRGADLSWGSKGMILMDGQFTDSLMVVPASGGELRPATRVDRALHEVGTGWPCFLPDGRHFLYIGNLENGTGTGNMRLGQLGSLDSKLLGQSDGRAEYAPGGWVLFLRGVTLLAQKLDLGAGKLTGQPITVAENVRTGSSAGHFSASPSGVFAYASQDAGASILLQMSDRTGKPLAPAVTSTDCINPRLSPDGTRLLYETTGRAPSAQHEVWVRDLNRGTDAKLTFTSGSAHSPVWSPDGRRFACTIRSAGSTTILIGSVDGLGAADTLRVPGVDDFVVWQWSPATSKLVCFPQSFQGAFTVSTDSSRHEVTRLTGLPNVVGQPQISPDGRWLAYVTNEGTTQPQVYVQSLTGVPGRWQISTKLGIGPCWSKAGKELLFESNDSIMSVDVDSQGAFRASEPKPLFALPQPARGAIALTWIPSDDGQRFMLLVPPHGANHASIEVVTDFSRLVNRK
jgi:Tol biopolymer transport system component